MIFNVLSILGACYVFLTIGEFFYSLIHKIPPLLERRGGADTTTTANKNVENTNQTAKNSSTMTDSIDNSDKEGYQSELRKRRRRIAAGEVKGFSIGEQKQTEIFEDRKTATGETSDDGGGQMNRQNNLNQNVFGFSTSTPSYVLSGPEHWTGDAGVSMVGYYDSPPYGGGIGNTVRTVPQPSPQLSFEVEHHNHQRQNRQQLKVNYSPVIGHCESRSSLDSVPVKLLTTNSSSSLASGCSPFKISENSAFRPVHRTPSLDRDTQVSNCSEPVEPAKITIVMRNNINSVQKSKEIHPTTTVDHLTASSQRYGSNLGNNERKHSFSSSSPPVWSYDQSGVSSHQSKPLVTSKYTTVGDTTVPQSFHLPDKATEESVIKLKSTFHDFNKTADGFNANIGDKHMRSKKELFSIEKINSVPQLDTYSPLLTPKLLQQTSSNFAHLNNNNYFKKSEDDVAMALPGALRSAARLHKTSAFETTQKSTGFSNINQHGDVTSSRYPYPESPVKKESSSPGAVMLGAKSFEEKMLQAMQPSPTLACRQIKKPTIVVDTSLNAENITKTFVVDKIKPSENLARWQAEKLEYKKFRGPLSSTSSDKDGQFDVARDDLGGEQILFQTDDILKAGNVVAKAKLFETIAEHEKYKLDEKDIYKRRTGRKKTDRAHTMLASPRYLAPELYLESLEAQMYNDSCLPATSTSSGVKFGNFEYHQRSPSPLSSSDHEDDKSKMTMIEKAKLFEAKANDGEVNGSSKSANQKPEDRRKTQPVTQDELAKARTVIMKSIGHSMTDPSHGSSDNLHVFAKVSEYSSRTSSGSRQKNSSDVQTRLELSKNKPTNAVKPRKTVHLHTDKEKSSIIAEDDIINLQSRLAVKFLEEEKNFVNGFNNNGKCFSNENSHKRSTNRLTIEKNDNNCRNGYKNGFLKRNTIIEENGTLDIFSRPEYTLDNSDKIFIDDNSFQALVNTPTCKLTTFERPKPKRRHSMLNKNNFSKLRESEL